MADKLRLGSEVRELKIGQSFANSRAAAFHTVRYDFKPASVDINKIATVDVAKNHEVTVTVPHLDGAGVPQTVFKGSQRPYTKECVLIIDRVTGEITLEKLSSNLQVKKTRSESAKPHLPQASSDRTGSSSLSSVRPQTPPIGQRMSNKTRVTSGSRRGVDRVITPLVPKHSPLHASPSYPSPGHHKSPKRDIHANNDSHSSNALASLPALGGDDFMDTGVTHPPPQRAPVDKSPPLPQVQHHSDDDDNRVGEMSDSSSSSSDSDSDSDRENNTAVKVDRARTNGHVNGIQNNSSSVSKAAVPKNILNEDLCLSESGSDSE